MTTWPGTGLPATSAFAHLGSDYTMIAHKFSRLIERRLITNEELASTVRTAKAAGEFPEDLLLSGGIPKHEILFSLSEYYGLPYAEFDEGVLVSYFITMRLDMDQLKRSLWLPLSIGEDRAEVIVADPESPAVASDIRATLKVGSIDLIVALPSDLIRIIEHNFDVNPGFPRAAGRTPLAKVRTFLADRRSLMACSRTSLAKGRTGLAFLRTGISFIAISVVLFRFFGLGLSVILECLLLAAGMVMTVDGLVWYTRARRQGKAALNCASTEPTWGTTVLQVRHPGDNPSFIRTEAVEKASGLRSGWSSLSPVMRRRFLASDRTDFAEERTVLACFRTKMARARTGLAFTRTGIAFAGLGIAMLRQFHAGPWTVFDASLIILGVLMAGEGFYWYLPGRRAGREGQKSVSRSQQGKTIWDLAFPPAIQEPPAGQVPPPHVRPGHAPGIWATTGLALERTILADRRNVMARLRTVMARSRTGLAFIRTGMSIAAVGMGLLAYFGLASIPWTILNLLLVAAGLLLVADGLYWHLPADKIRKQYPYCYGEMEMTIPDYGRPARTWKKAVFNSDIDA